MKKLLTLFLILSAFVSFAQDQHPIDSLNRELQQHKRDTSGVIVLDKLAETYYWHAEYYKAISYAKQGVALSEQIGFKRGIGISRQRLGRIYVELGNYGDALKEQFTALRIMQELEDQQGSASSLITIGLIYTYQGLYDEALKNYQSALTISNSINDKSLLYRCYTNLGFLLLNKNKYQEALNYFLSCQKIAEELGDKLRMATTYNQLADCYYHLENYPVATDYYFKALKIGEEVGSKDPVFEANEGLGNMSLSSHQYAAARSYFINSLMLAKDLGSKNGMAISYAQLSTLDSIEGNFKQSLEHYKRSIVYRDSMDNSEAIQKITQVQMQNDFEKKEAATKAASNAELNKQKLLRNGFVGGFAVVLLFAGVFFRQRNKTKKEKLRSDALLLNILPEEVAEELKEKGSAEAKQFDEVTVMFTDFKDFTQISEKLTPSELVAEIDTCFKTFDQIISQYNIEKIKTIGDSYMCAGGLPVANATHATDVVNAALKIQQFMHERLQERNKTNKEIFELRIGIHTGPVVAGIVGIKKFAYDIWGDTVNIASRMESSGEAEKVNISGSTHELVKDKFICTYRGKIQAKNKGEIDMYFVDHHP